MECCIRLRKRARSRFQATKLIVLFRFVCSRYEIKCVGCFVFRLAGQSAIVQMHIGRGSTSLSLSLFRSLIHNRIVAVQAAQVRRHDVQRDDLRARGEQKDQTGMFIHFEILLYFCFLLILFFFSAD